MPVRQGSRLQNQKILTTQLLINHFTCVLVDEVSLNDMFCDINAN